jgi:hypothetical protein
MIRAAVLALLVATPASANEACGALEQWARVLGDRFEESPTFIGRITTGRVVSVWINEENGSWTLLITDHDETCIVYSGDAGQIVPLGELM